MRRTKKTDPKLLTDAVQAQLWRSFVPSSTLLR